MLNFDFQHFKALTSMTEVLTSKDNQNLTITESMLFQSLPGGSSVNILSCTVHCAAGSFMNCSVRIKAPVILKSSNLVARVILSFIFPPITAIYQIS